MFMDSNKIKKKKNEINYEHGYNGLMISNKLQIRWFVIRVCGWEEMGWVVKEEENGFWERTMEMVF